MIIRILLTPVAWIYGFFISLRNLLYDTGVLRSSKFSIPIISVGNLSIGGAGKTPHVEYLIRLLNPFLDVATLSRGYNRQTTGYRAVKREDTALSVGDEPLMYARKYPDIFVAVGENRSLAIPQMVMQRPGLQTLLLDDAYQHRSVLSNVNILLTPYDQPYTEDALLPAGRLREYASSSKRANIIIVTKCPSDLSQKQREEMIAKISPEANQEVYFTCYEYGLPYSFYNGGNNLPLNKEVDAVIISAIANTQYMMQYLNPLLGSHTLLEYEDHHNFNGDDVEYLIKIYRGRESKNCIVLTTEKDAVRLATHIQRLHSEKIPVYVLPLRVNFLHQDQLRFDESIRQSLLEFKN